MPRYLVGVDLGTTNSALAFVDTHAKGRGPAQLHPFPVPQLVAAGQVAAPALLPSFLYLPGTHDLPPGAAALPWDANAADIVGQFARQQGARVPGRLVSSAKSWLSHPGVDRSAPLLPWGAPPDVPRLSPLETSTRYLRHLVDAWNHAPGRKPDDHLEKQPVVLTVPASFDDVARQLTAEAAKQAGLTDVTLLEEPQAAFYAWLGTHTPQEAAELKPGMVCVVVDVGGGTSDFSLIRAGEERGELTFERVAVGDHLLLGGDNMDLALAKSVEQKFPAGRLDAAQFGALVQACRAAKEALLGPNPPAAVPVTVAGRGRSVVAGSVTVDLTAADVNAALFDGFFPHCPADAEPERGRGGLQEMGLPYVADAGVTRHLAAFLRKHLPGAAPDAILFNGGVFTPASLRERVVAVMRTWYGEAWTPKVLTSPSLDLAVAWGAAYFNHLKRSGGRRIGGGVARSYYLGLGSASQVAPGATPVLCVVPRRFEEGSEVALERPELELQLGQPVLFPLYTSTVRGDDKPGDLLSVDPKQLLELPPLHTVLRGGKRAGAKKVPVTLLAKTTEIGTLELYCVSREGNRWRLEFNTRDVTRAPAVRGAAKGGEPEKADAPPALLDVYPEEKVQAAGEAVRAAFLGSASPAELPKALEAALDASRSEWPAGLCRRLWDFVLEVAEKRGRSPAHLSRWYNLAGFCLRPGYGDPVDRYRVEALWKQLAGAASGAGKGPALPPGGADYWILIRRAAGGVNGAWQQLLWNQLRPALLPAKGKPAPKLPMNELAEMWRAAASLERIDPRLKVQLGELLLGQLGSGPPAPPYLWGALTRLGARRPLYGPLNGVVHPDVAGGWLDRVLAADASDRPGRQFCVAQLARRTGVRGVDLSDERRAAAAAALRGEGAPGHWVALVEEGGADEGDEASRLFGEALPLGLSLAAG